MSQPFNSMITIPLRRARSYPHTWPSDPHWDAGDSGIVDLHVEHFVVDISVVEVGMVTLAASTTEVQRDAYGQEYDMSPAAARSLASQLIAAADELERAPRAFTRSDQVLLALLGHPERISAYSATDE